MDDKYWNMIVKYLGDECDLEEKAEIEQLLEIDTEFKEAFDEANSIWVKAPTTKTLFANSDQDISVNFSVDSILAKIDERVEYLEKENTTQHLTISKPFYQRREVLISGVAASLLLLIGFFYLIPSIEDNTTGTPVAITNIENPKGSKAKLVSLPDGSNVFLAGGSSVSYNPDEFTNTQRLVKLEGEAYFEVAKNPQRPFFVLTDKTETRVLGTAFNIKAYKDLNNIVLTVTEGKVRFSELDAANKQHTSVNLVKNEEVVFDRSNNKFNDVKKLSAVNTTRWKKHQIVFEDNTLEEAAVILENRFNKQIVVKGEDLGSRKITGNFADRNLQEIIEVISIALEVDYETTQDQIILTKKEI